ncbi:MAG: hypothetical protein M1269_02390 [Chloroflexi bacterium]|nr:hypothetical protein [Chloroflexota bacterium]
MSNLTFLNILAFILLAEAVVGMYIIHRRDKVVAVLEEDALVYKDQTKERKIPFIEILKLYFSPYLGSLKLITKTGSIKILPALDDYPYFILRLKSAMDQNNMSDRYDRKGLYKSLLGSAYNDQSCDRLFPNFWISLLLIIPFGFFGSIVAYMTRPNIPMGNSMRPFDFFFLSCTYPFALMIVVELICYLRFKKMSDEETLRIPERDRKFERKVYAHVIFWGVIFFFIIAFGLAMIINHSQINTPL